MRFWILIEWDSLLFSKYIIIGDKNDDLRYNFCVKQSIFKVFSSSAILIPLHTAITIDNIKGWIYDGEILCWKKYEDNS